MAFENGARLSSACLDAVYDGDVGVRKVILGNRFVYIADDVFDAQQAVNGCRFEPNLGLRIGGELWPDYIASGRSRYYGHLCPS